MRKRTWSIVFLAVAAVLLPTVGKRFVADANGNPETSEIQVARSVVDPLPRYEITPFDQPIEQLDRRTSSGVVLADFDGDGRRDLVGIETGRLVLKLLDEPSLPSDKTITTTATGDINRDGYPDLLAATEDGLLLVMLGESEGRFSLPLAFGAVPGSTKIEIAQMNVDGTPDVVMDDALGQLAVLRGTGDGGFAAPEYVVGVGRISSWQTARLDADGTDDLIVQGDGGLMRIVADPRQAQTLTVTTTEDNGNNETPTAGSLRAALLAATGGPNGTIINFAIPGNQVTGNIFIFKPPAEKPLPPLNKNGITINGDSQALTSNTNPNGPEIFIDASNNGIPTGLSITSVANCVIRNLGIVGAGTAGIQISGAGASNNRIESCYIGTNADATNTGSPKGNTIGVLISSPAFGNTVGGTGTARNVISGNTGTGITIEGAGTNSNVVRNNIIGLDRTAALAVANGSHGIVVQGVASITTIGGTGTGEGNIIGKNNGTGILVSGAGTISTSIFGNLIGTNAARTNLGNAGDGIRLVNGATLTAVGGSGVGAANVIAFNGGAGVKIGVDSADTTTQRNTVSRNSIFGNTGLGIDLGNTGATANDALDADDGPNTLINKPLVESVTLNGTNLVIAGRLNPVVTTGTVELFADAAPITAPPTPASQQFLTSVTPQQDGTFTATVTAPNGTFTVTATYTDTQGNTSEFSDAAQVQQQPDLVVQNPAVTPNSVAGGGTVTVTFTIRNQGNAATTVTSTASVVLSSDNVIDGTDTPLTTVATQPLAVGAAVNLTANNVTIPVSASPGARFIGIIADSGNAIVESNETNNTGSVALTIAAPKPDLAVGALNLSGAGVSPGDSITVNLTVSNRGTGAAGASVTQIRLSTDAIINANDPLLNSINTGGIAGGASLPLTVSVTIPAGTTPGQYFIGIVLDATGVVDESDETNNTGNAPFVVAGLSDLIVETLTVAPTSVSAGASITVTFTIRNQGATEAGSTTHDILLSDDNVIRNGEDLLLISRATAPLAPGGTSAISVTITVPSSVLPGSKFIGVIADPSNLVPESLENNNTRSTALSIVDTVPPTVSLVRPNGGEALAAGRTFSQIEWTAADNIGVSAQELRLSTDGGLTFPTVISTGIAGEVRTFQWNVPSTLNTTNARVQIIVRDAAGNQATAASAGNFTIAPPPLILPGFKLSASGKFLFVGTGSNIQTGAKLRITVGATTETFDFTFNANNGKYLVKPNVRSTPGNKTVREVLPTGTQSTLVIVNPNGVTSAPTAFTAP